VCGNARRKKKYLCHYIERAKLDNLPWAMYCNAGRIDIGLRLVHRSSGNWGSCAKCEQASDSIHLGCV
jgi:hypothetical protein